MKRIIIIAILAAGLSSCGVYGRVQRTEDVDDALYGSEYMPADTASIASLPWPELFRDTCLQRLIDTALVRNSDLKTAHLRVDQAEAALLTARLSYLPALNLNAEGTSGKAYNVGGAAAWEVDIFGRLTASRREARASLEQSRAYMQAVRTSLIASVASGYYTLLMLDEQIAIAGETLDSWQRMVNALKALKRAGAANDAAVLQAEANRASLEASLLSMRKSLKEAENALCLLLARTPGTIERGRLDEQVFPDTLSAGLPVSLLANRPDVREAEMALAKSFYATNVARAAFYPTVSLSGNAGWTNNDGLVIANPAQWITNAVASLTMPLFNRAANVANLKIARAEQEAAEVAFRQKLLAAGGEVNNAMVSWQTARERIKIDTGSAKALEVAVRKTELLMRHSSVNYLEVLTAQQSLLAARQSLAQDRFDEINSVITLYHALGGGE